MAAKKWGGASEVMTMTPAERDTYEYLFHAAAQQGEHKDYAVILRKLNSGAINQKLSMCW